LVDTGKRLIALQHQMKRLLVAADAAFDEGWSAAEVETMTRGAALKLTREAMVEYRDECLEELRQTGCAMGLRAARREADKLIAAEMLDLGDEPQAEGLH
jgi:hypothetical protein